MPELTTISLGWGLQSWTLAAMSALGELPPVDFAIHSNTTWERRATYEFARVWTPWLEERGTKVVTVSNPERAGSVVNDHAGVFIPAYTIRPAYTTISDGYYWGTDSDDEPVKMFDSNLVGQEIKHSESKGRLNRQCTEDWKIVPIRRYISKELKRRGLKKTPSVVEMWLGITLDEWTRAKDNSVKYIKHRFPLLDLKMDRAACVAWLERHGLGVPVKSTCTFCLAGETEVITPTGAKPIAELVGNSTLLIPIPKSGWGRWRTVEVRSFGIQPLMKITLRRGRALKIIFATHKHRWIIKNKRDCWDKFTNTDALRPGLAIPLCRSKSVLASRHPIKLSPFGVARGFVFGDGSFKSGRNSPASVDLHGDKDKVMLPYFSLCDPREITFPSGKKGFYIYNLPKYWKKVPPLDESKSFLMGWLAGYFAADGCVSKRGQASISSSDIDNIRFIRDLCYLLGVQTSPIKTCMRKGFNSIKEPLYSTDLYTRDLPDLFWITKRHRLRIQKRHDNSGIRRQDWIVESVEETDRVEEVYCAIVPGEEMFTLADNVVTGNCVFHNKHLWQFMKRENDHDWKQAVKVDAAIRDKRPPYPLFVHPARVPLPEAVKIPEDYGASQLSLFDTDAECDSGYCFL